MLGNLILETCNAPGTAADCLLLGPTAGRLSFGFWFSSGSQCFYVLADGSQSEWGIGTYTAGSPNKLTRTTVLKNSAGSTARLNFLGTTRIYNETPSEKSLWVDTAGNVTINGSLAIQALNIVRNAPAILSLQDTSSGSDAKIWDFASIAGTLYGRAINDLYNASTAWLTVNRSGYTTTGITLAATNITLTGAATVNGALTVTSNLSVTGNYTLTGSFTTTNAITAGSLRSTLDAQVDRNLTVNATVTAVTGNITTINATNIGASSVGAAYINSSGSVDSQYLYSRGDGRVDGNWSAATLNVIGAINNVGGNVTIQGMVTTNNRIRIAVGDNGFQANTHGYYVTINGSTDFVNAANFIVSGGGRSGYAFEYYWGGTRIGEMDTGGSFSLRGNITTTNTVFCGAVRSTSGLFEVAPGYYLQRGGDGAWRFVEGGTINCTISTDGNINPRSGLITQNLLLYGDSDCRGRAYAADQNMWMGYGGNGRIMQFNPSAYWEWGGDYALQYYRGDRGVHFVMRGDGWIENRLAGGAGQADWYVVSDIRKKENVVNATTGLAAILGLEPIRYTRIKRAVGDETGEHSIPRLGFSAQQIRSFIPEAVMEFPDTDNPGDPEPTLAVSTIPIVAAMVNAFRELHDLLNEMREKLDVATRRIVILESRVAAQEG